MKQNCTLDYKLVEQLLKDQLMRIDHLVTCPSRVDKSLLLSVKGADQ